MFKRSKLILAALLLSAISAGAIWISSSSAAESDTWVKFATWDNPTENPQDWFYDPNSVHDVHGITVVNLKASTPNPTTMNGVKNVVYFIQSFGIDCINGRYIAGGAEYYGRQGPPVRMEADPRARWKRLHPANMMWNVAKNVC